ncbi:LamG-like jellyroll fold domain-containing protein [Archangium lipolyticum]|uniref:LamG-like jellyroll fold domain-containing protein n=1 Tax=Archangium lipolyticum TaxID=2970465 RepID=UPI002149A75B|nr:LamG-like jellyroll fold domain-containing protein [Archangium lipolyticum]
MLLHPLTGVAASNDWFSDDFETGTLRASEIPAGRWSVVGASSPNALSNGAVGAHRGQYGLTVVDRTNASTPDSEASVSSDERAPLSSEFFVRAWMRLRDVSTPGSLVALQALPVQVELRLRSQSAGPVWELAVMTGASRTYVSFFGSRVEADRWHLVEFSASGLGTRSGEARLWVDGVEQGTGVSGRDWTDPSYVMKRVVMGEPWADSRTFTGTLDFDDVRVSATPMASRLVLRWPVDAATSSGCIPLEVSLRSSATGAPAPAPYETEVALAVTAGAGGFHSDEACKSPVPGMLLPTGASERRVYFRPGGTGGTAMLAASHPDFLPATLEVVGGGAPDGDPDEDPAGPWTTDLGCTSAPGALVALPLLLGPWLRRRSWRPGAPTCPVE